MSGYKNGDKIKIKDDLEINACYDTFRFSPSMDDFRGRIVTITSVDNLGEYRIEEDLNRFIWTDAMIEKKVNLSKSDLKTGMIVTLRDGEEYWVMIDDTVSGESVFVHMEGKEYIPFDDYTYDLLWYTSNRKKDIIKIEQPEYWYRSAKRTLICEREEIEEIEEEIKEVTMEEVEKKFGCKVKIVNQ